MRAISQSPVKVFSQGVLPATPAVLKSTGGTTFIFIRIISTVIYKITPLLWLITLAILTFPIARGAGT